MSVKKTLDTFDSFFKFSGLKVNIEKTQAIPLGSLKHLSKSTLFGLNWASPFVESLGVKFTSNEIDNYNHNFKPRILKLKNLFRIWQCRKLSLKGKVTIINSLGLSPFIYLANSINVPERVYTEVKEIIKDFVWNGGSPKISYNTLTLDIAHGGLKLIDLKTKVESLHITWIKRLCSEDNANWKSFAKHWFKTDNLYEYFNRNFSPTKIVNKF